MSPMTILELLAWVAHDLPELLDLDPDTVEPGSALHDACRAVDAARALHAVHGQALSAEITIRSLTKQP